jgi:hypothetical protein
VPAAKDEIVLLVPVPVIPPGLIVQEPAGRLFKITLPVETPHEGCVIVPTAGAAGIEEGLIVTVDVVPELQKFEIT